MRLDAGLTDLERRRELEIEAEYLLNLQRVIDENANSNSSTYDVSEVRSIAVVGQPSYQAQSKGSRL